VSRPFWLGSLASLVAVRVAIPLVVLAAAGHDLPGLPPYDYSPLNGDATGFYAEARELISVAFGPAGAAALLLVAAGAAAVWRLGRTWVSIAVGCLAVSLAASALVLGSEPTGAAVVGWPLLWSIPLLPLRVVGVLGDDVAFAVGLLLSLAAIAVTVVATAFIGLVPRAGTDRPGRPDRGAGRPPRLLRTSAHAGDGQGSQRMKTISLDVFA